MFLSCLFHFCVTPYIFTRATYTYANGYHTKTTWKNNGATSATVVYQRMAEDSLGNVTQIKTGSVTRTYKYNAYGFPTQRTAKNSSNTVILNQSYTFNANTGNLTKRTDNLKNKNESFTYDNLDRLRKYGNDSITYDVKGNILTKTDAGTYQYTNTAKPYAVTALAPASNSVPLRAQTVTYTSLQRPATITENGYTATFTYDDEGNRMKEVITHNSAAYLTKYYIGGIYEKETNTSNTTERLYLEGDYYSAPMVLTKTGTGSWTLRNILRDYQGSILKVTNSAGTTTNGEYSYDAWGRMRNPSTWAVYAVGSEPSLYLGRGYTGHEHLPMFGLVNMNARLYDPVLGRFLAPDPYVQASDFSQSYNRYGYCMNNPMKYVDEDGEFLHIVIGAILGGGANLFSNWNHIDGFWQGLTSFVTGAAAGAVTAATGGTGASIWGIAGIAAASSSITSGVNSIIAQTGKNFSGFSNVNWGGVGISSVVGGVAGFAGGAAGYAAANASFVVNGLDNPIARVAVVSPLAAGAGHIAGGTAMGIANGQSLGDAFTGSFRGIGSDMALGTAMGVASAMGMQHIQKLNQSSAKNKISPHQKGREGVQMAIDEIAAEGGVIIGQEVTLDMPGVARVRADLVVDMNGQIQIVEVKNGPSAHFTKNQSKVYPLMEKGLPIIPRGNNAARINLWKVGQPVLDYKFVYKHYNKFK